MYFYQKKFTLYELVSKNIIVANMTTEAVSRIKNLSVKFWHSGTPILATPAIICAIEVKIFNVMKKTKSQFN